METIDGKPDDSLHIQTPTELFDAFIQANDLPETLSIFKNLCSSLDVNPKNHKTVYLSLKNGLTTWKARSLWTKLDKRADHKDYKGKPCAKNKVLVIGAGPCGLRAAIEAALLGAQVVVLEKRDRFSRNNVLHLWPFLITDLKDLGAKKFFGQFCAGSLDHISKFFISSPISNKNVSTCPELIGSWISIAIDTHYEYIKFNQRPHCFDLSHFLIVVFFRFCVRI